MGAWLLPDAGPYVHAFLGATLTATSVGITAQVLAAKRLLSARASQTILAAAVIDDVLGLLILAAVSSMAATQPMRPGLNWIPSGGTVVVSQDGATPAWPKGTIVTPKTNLIDLITTVHPVFAKYSDEARGSL